MVVVTEYGKPLPTKVVFGVVLFTHMVISYNVTPLATTHNKRKIGAYYFAA